MRILAFILHLLTITFLPSSSSPEPQRFLLSKTKTVFRLGLMCPRLPRTQLVANSNSESVIMQPLPCECWDHKHSPPYWGFAELLGGAQGFLHTLYPLSHTPSPPFCKFRISRCSKLHESANCTEQHADRRRPSVEGTLKAFLLSGWSKWSQAPVAVPSASCFLEASSPKSCTFNYLSSNKQPKHISIKQPKCEPCLFPL